MVSECFGWSQKLVKSILKTEAGAGMLPAFYFKELLQGFG
jgi:hypothetical protein